MELSDRPNTNFLGVADYRWELTFMELKRLHEDDPEKFKALRRLDDVIEIFREAVESVEPEDASMLWQGVKEMEDHVIKLFPDLKRRAEDEEESVDDGEGKAGYNSIDGSEEKER
jgi:hypothetical protein